MPQEQTAGADNRDSYLRRHYDDTPEVREATLALAELERLKQTHSADDALTGMLRVSRYGRVLMLADLEPWAHAYSEKTKGLNTGKGRYSETVHRKAETLVQQLMSGRATQKAAIEEASAELGIPFKTIKRWGKDKLIDIYPSGTLSPPPERPTFYMPPSWLGHRRPLRR